MMAYFGRIAAARRARGAEDLLTALVDAEVEGKSLEDWEILGFCMVDRPVLWQKLREDRSLVDRVIEETLRYDKRQALSCRASNSCRWC